MNRGGLIPIAPSPLKFAAKCKRVHGKAMQGLRDKPLEGESGILEPRCKSWNSEGDQYCTPCRHFQINKANFWHYVTIVQWCDPKRLMQGFPPIQADMLKKGKKGKNGEPPNVKNILTPPGITCDEPIEMWNPFAAMFPQTQSKAVLERLKRTAKKHDFSFEYVCILTNPALFLDHDFRSQFSLGGDEYIRDDSNLLESIGFTTATDINIACLCAININMAAMPDPFQHVYSDEAIFILDAALNASPRTKQGNAKSKGKNRITRSQGWTPKSQKKEDKLWRTIGNINSGAKVEDIEAKIKQFGGKIEGGIAVNEPDVMNSTKWDDFDVGGTLASFAILRLEDRRVYDPDGTGLMPTTCDAWVAFIRRCALPSTSRNEQILNGILWRMPQPDDQFLFDRV